jgi:hypothetical protein
MDLDAVISSFQQLQLADLQRKLLHLSPEELAQLRDRYKAQHEKFRRDRTLEQVLIAIPLWILTQRKPDHMSEVDYMRLALNVQDTVETLHFQLDKLLRNTTDSGEVPTLSQSEQSG